VARLRPGLVQEHAILTAHSESDKVWSGAAPAVGAGPLLEVRDVVMQFGGLKALAGVDLAVRPGTIHGLIGPNGSGKSTMMNVLTGIYKPTGGSVALATAAGSQRLDGRTPSEIALAGVARTFQNVQLFREMTA